MSKPVIGIFASAIQNQHPLFSHGEISALNLSYSNAVLRNGGCPVIIPYGSDRSSLIETLSLCKGAVIPGGVDVDPRYYGEAPHPDLGTVDPTLDKLELDALAYLMKNNVPTLGICRGCQIMNIFAGGSVYQDISVEYEGRALMHTQRSKSCSTIHRVDLAFGSRIRELLKAESVHVNSVHHQAIRKLGRGFTATGHAQDGVIEAIEHENGVWMAVQWHPEELIDTLPVMNALFRALVDMAILRS
ncbi:MAG TPA: gamma-glutamyl-gamma-aminobutyrate hydrolase family protein [Clostridia bacterium]|nr:gamma-glutamyl-gamma-aminobutyrate hydrolase family protein [Clostridia bacterium]